MASTQDDTEDVNDFLRRVRELSVQRDQEDENRNKKLEEEILKSRAERQARRAERARSLSPTKPNLAPESAVTPSPAPESAVPKPTPTTPSRSPRPSKPDSPGPSHVEKPLADRTPTDEAPEARRDLAIDNALESLTGGRSRGSGTMVPSVGREPSVRPRSSGEGPKFVKPPPGTAVPSRKGTLSWQQRRPPSNPADRGRGRALSQIATENAARSPRATAENAARSPRAAVESDNNTNTQPSRSQIAHSLSSKDPAWFRQTADRAASSAAYRKKQVEDTAHNTAHPEPATMDPKQLSGMGGDKPKAADGRSSPLLQNEQHAPAPRQALTYGAGAATLNSSTTPKITESPLLVTAERRFEPPAASIASSTDEGQAAASRPLAMSPAQGRISPERLDRPRSPMKGVGGFVQSAMNKRSDSVSKRWSQQAPPDMAREQSRASHARSRSVYGEMSPRSTSRPASSLSNATVKQENERPGTSGSMTSNTTNSTSNDGFIKPALPASRSDDTASVLSSAPSENIPTTPSKTMDSRRWSPTKSSWLESALSKPDAPKPKAAPGQQPSWMAEINKAKQRGTGSADQSRDPSPAHKHLVSIGGLMRSPAMGTSTSSPKPLGFGLMSPPINTGTVSPTIDTKPTTPNTETESTPAASPSPTIESPATRTGTSSTTKTAKPETPSKTDFRATLKSRQPALGLGTKEEPEFKNVFGQLRRTQTSQYTPPDGLKDNIFRGKAGLSHTGGPKATERKDELKDALLKKKDDFKKTQQEGASVLGSSSIDKGKTSSPLPEALAKRNTLGRSGSIPFIPPATTDARPDSLVIPEALAMRRALGRSGSYASSSPVKEGAEAESLASADAKPDPLQKEMGAPGRLPGKDAAPSKLAGRLNPALAGLLARGPPSMASDNSKSSSVTASSDHETKQGAQEIAHVTKGRARGPKRKAPSSAALSVATTSSQAPEPAARPIKNMAKVESVKAAEKPLSTQTQPLPTPSAKASEPEPSVRPVSPTKAVDKDSSSRPSSPSKLAMKRRSRFFEEASSSASAVPKPLSPQKTGSAELKNKFESLASQAAKPESSELKSPSPSATPKPLIPQKTGNADLRNKFESLTSQAAKKPEGLEHRSPSPTATPKPLAPQKTGNADLRNKFESLASQTAKPEGPEPRSSSPLKKLGSADLKSKFEAMSGPAFASNAKPEVVESPTVKPPPVTPKTKPETIETPVLKPSSAAKSPSGAISPQLARKPWENRTNDKPEPATPIDATSSSRVSRAALSPTLPILPPQNHVSDNGSNISKSSDNMAELPSASNPTQSLPRADSRPSLLQKSSTSIRTLQTQASDTSELLADFFDTLDVSKEFTVDTAKLLLAKPTTRSDLRTTHFQLYELADDGKKQQMSSQQERTLFESNMYLGIHAFISGGKKTTEVYLWIGDDVQEYAAEDAEFFARRDARTAGARLIRMKQGQETPEFFQAFGGVIITRRGSSRKYDSMKPAILCGRRHHGQIAFDEVDFDPSSLCSGYPYLILSEKGKAYLWKGKGSGIDELSCARLVGMEMGCTGDIQEIEDGKEPAAFLQIFGKDAQIPESADHWRLKPNYSKYGARLFVSTGGTITEVHPFCQSDLSPEHIYILDAFFEIYIVVGAKSKGEYSAFYTALVFAQEYGILAASIEDRPFVPYSTVVLEGVPKDMKKVFRKWNDAKSPTVTVKKKPAPNGGLQRGRSLRIVPLAAALEATRTDAN